MQSPMLENYWRHVKMLSIICQRLNKDLSVTCYGLAFPTGEAEKALVLLLIYTSNFWFSSIKHCTKDQFV